MDVLNAIGIIPARYESTRLPGKLLRDLGGKPVLQWVWEGASKSQLLSRLVVATDSERIANLCRSIGAEFIITPNDITSGSDRVLYSYNQLKVDANIVVNIQGDEPFINGNLIDILIRELEASSSDVSTLIKKIDNEQEIFEPSVVKVVFDNAGFALYFSRSAIPFVRDKAKGEWHKLNCFYKHIGIYAFKSDVLRLFASIPQSNLEEIEKLEQLRLLQNGYKIRCIETDANLIGIDTIEDLEKAKEFVRILPSLE